MPKVLIADDHPVHRMLAAAQFEALGFEVRFAADGLEAALAAYHHSFEIVVLDRHMPRWDGDHAARVIRDPASASRQTILVCHSSDPPEDFAGLGYDMAAPKPLSPGVLQSLVSARVAACAALDRVGQAPCSVCPFGALDERSARRTAGADTAPRPHVEVFPQSFDALRTRDLEILCCLACGDDVDGIARYVGVSVRTVRDAMRRASRQLGLDSVLSLRRLASGLLQGDPSARVLH